MAVALNAAKRHEQGAGGERARVARHSTHDRVRRAEHLAACCGRDFVEPEGALVDWYRRRHRWARAGRSPETDTDLTVITCTDAAWQPCAGRTRLVSSKAAASGVHRGPMPKRRLS